MKRSGFSMIELVFVIVILGVLAAVAVPRFVTTRTDAQVAMARSDIATTLKQIPAKVFAANMNVKEDNGFKVDKGICGKDNQGNGNGSLCKGGWGEWMMKVSGLDPNKWAFGSTNGNRGAYLYVLSGKDENGKQKMCGNDGASKGIILMVAPGTTQINANGGNIPVQEGDLVLNINNITNNEANKSAFCNGLRNSYPSGARVRHIPLTTEDSIAW